MTFSQMVVRVIGNARSAKRGDLRVFFTITKMDLYCRRGDAEIKPWHPSLEDVHASDWEIVE